MIAIPYKSVVIAVFLFCSTVLLFSRLGEYALWDDESYTALAAKSILQTGDTSALCGENIVAYRNGLLLKGLNDRSTPPLSSYLCAISIYLFGETAWAVRFPFALMGLLLMGVAAYIIGKSKLTSTESFIWCVGILGNTSLFLYLRQGRYYAPAILLSFLIAVCYISLRRDNKRLILLAVLMAALFSANYMNCVALICCMGLDYLIWERHSDPLSLPQFAIFSTIFGFPCVLIALIWNPLGTKISSYAQDNGLSDRITLLYWNVRDMNEAGFMIAGLIVLAFYLAFFRKKTWLMRGLTMIFVYVAVISLASPQIVKGTSQGDIRYLAPLIPFCTAVAVSAYIIQLKSRKSWALALAIPVFLTNIINGTFLTGQGVRSVPLEFCCELLSPPKDPYKPTAEWLRKNVQAGSSVWVLPDYMTYPLMFHAPDVIYAWQLRPIQKQEKQFEKLPDIHFQGIVSPDYIVVFGPMVLQIRTMLEKWRAMGVSYEEAYRINTFWKDLYRPELFWRSFKPIVGFEPSTEGVYIFHKANIFPSKNTKADGSESASHLAFAGAREKESH